MTVFTEIFRPRVAGSEEVNLFLFNIVIVSNHETKLYVIYCDANNDFVLIAKSVLTAYGNGCLSTLNFLSFYVTTQCFIAALGRQQCDQIWRKFVSRARF